MPTPSQATQPDVVPTSISTSKSPTFLAPNPQRSFERGNLVFFEGKRFELEDMLRASAEMLGKGGFGTAYKAVLDNGDVVAVKRLKDSVKRLKDVQVGPKREMFERHMEVLENFRMRCMSNGTLFWLLHDSRGPARTQFDWTLR